MYIEYDVPLSVLKSTSILVNNYKGINLSGTEDNRGPGKTYERDYVYPNTTEIDYYISKGFGIIRLPFDLTRVYPIPYSILDPIELGYMKPIVDYCLSKGMRVILDPHNGGFIYDNRTGTEHEIGVDTEGTNMFTDFWNRMATVYKNYSNVIFVLMNEPQNQTAAESLIIRYAKKNYVCFFGENYLY